MNSYWNTFFDCRTKHYSLGTEKYKSKVVHKTLNPIWREQFDLHLYEDPYWGQELDVSIWDRDKGHQDETMGKAIINLTNLERETTHRIWQDLEEGSGSIFLLLTISGTTASETISDLAVHEETPQERVHLKQRYSTSNTFQRLRDVGHLTVKVLGKPFIDKVCIFNLILGLSRTRFGRSRLGR